MDRKEDGLDDKRLFERGGDDVAFACDFEVESVVGGDSSSEDGVDGRDCDCEWRDDDRG